jgi:cell fate regulator YaaT (PSP1 superfamily)
MWQHQLVRVGALSHVGRFAPVDGTSYPRGSRVVLRTARGLELGEVLSSPLDAPARGLTDGSILRGMTVEDQLLESRLERNRQQAFAACADRIREYRLAATLVDVEQLFDGRSLFFYFLGIPPPELEALTNELADVYDSAAQIRRFADTMSEGCGPGCGTAEASGGGCSTCATGCAIAGACGTRKG